MEKSVDAFRTISEVADDLQLPQHVLRFWETRFAQIRPLKRAGGRRYYRPADIVLLRSIRRLLYDQGYTIKGVQRLLKDKGGARVDEPARADLSSDRETLPPSEEASPIETDLRQEPTGAAVPDDVLDGDVRIIHDPLNLRDVLAIIEDCERILRTVREPCN